MENIEQKIEAAGQSQVNAIATLNAQNVNFGNKPDRNVSLNDRKPSFDRMQGRKIGRASCRERVCELV